MKYEYKKLGNETVVRVKQEFEDFASLDALKAKRFVLVAEINAMRSYILNREFQLRCTVLEKVVEEIDKKLNEF